MSDKPKRETIEKKAMRLAEATDVSVRQAKDLMKKHGKDKPESREGGKELQGRGMSLNAARRRSDRFTGGCVFFASVASVDRLFALYSPWLKCPWNATPP
ncbi:MAG: hypothetical protein L0I29_11120 [Hyphomicrobiales bacterium]|nr:hypothetical protein [Hyphomicrobiales bacterium]